MSSIKYDRVRVETPISTLVNTQVDAEYKIDNNYRVVGYNLINDANGLDATNGEITDSAVSIVDAAGNLHANEIPTQVIELGTSIPMDKRFMAINIQGNQTIKVRLLNRTAVGGDAGDEIKKTVVFKLMREDTYQALVNKSK